MTDAVPESQQCGTMVDGGMLSYRCELRAGHIGVPAEDPEPCMSSESERSLRIHANWDARRQVAKLAVTPAQLGQRIDCPSCSTPGAMVIKGDSGQCEECGTSLDAQSEPEQVDLDPGVSPALASLSMESAVRTLATARGLDPDDVMADVNALLTATTEQDEVKVEQLQAEASEAPVFRRLAEEEPEHNTLDYACMVGHSENFEPGQFCEICNPYHRPAVLLVNRSMINDGQMHNPFDAECTRSRMSTPPIEDERCYICRPELAVCDDTEPDQAPEPAPVPTKQRPGDQRLPSGGQREVQADIIREVMEESIRVGTERYGQPLHTFDGRLNIRDAEDEARDLFVYLHKARLTAEADRETLVQAAVAAIHEAFATDSGQYRVLDNTRPIAEVVIDRVIDWVAAQRPQPEPDPEPEPPAPPARPRANGSDFPIQKIGNGE